MRTGTKASSRSRRCSGRSVPPIDASMAYSPGATLAMLNRPFLTVTTSAGGAVSLEPVERNHGVRCHGARAVQDGSADRERAATPHANLEIFDVRLIEPYRFCFCRGCSGGIAGSQQTLTPDGTAGWKFEPSAVRRRRYSARAEV